MEDTYVLEDAAETVYERPEQHGEPEDTFDIIAGFWNTYLEALGAPPEILDSADVAKMFIQMKIARSVNGHYDEDNPVDVAGYAENWGRLEAEANRHLEYKEADKTGVARGVWDAWNNQTITTEERDQILNHILQQKNVTKF